MCIYVVSIVLPGLPEHADVPHKKRIFTHVGLSAQKVEVHGWLLSGSEELFAALF